MKQSSLKKAGAASRFPQGKKNYKTERAIGIDHAERDRNQKPRGTTRQRYINVDGVQKKKKKERRKPASRDWKEL